MKFSSDVQHAKVIGKEKGGESSRSSPSHRSSSRDDRGEKSKSANQNFPPHVKDLIQVRILSDHHRWSVFKPFFFLQTIDQLRKNMILGLQKDPNFKFEKDWEFFTNMFKKQVQ